MSESARSTARWFIWIGAFALFVLHQDFWFWDDRTIVLGFLPIGLAYHAGFSIAAGLLWWSAVVWMWPVEIEEWAESDDGGSRS